MNNQKVVFFDIDGTLIRGQSQKLFIDFVWRNGLVSSRFYARLMFWFLLYRLGIVKDPSKIASHAFSFLKNITREELSRHVEQFFNEVLIHQFYQEALLIIKEHQEKGRRVFLVSNAFDSLVGKVAVYVKADNYLSTDLKDEDGVLSGEINGIINYGKTKAERVKDFCLKNDVSLEDSWGYADHPSDIEFLKLMTHPVIVNGGNKFRGGGEILNVCFLQFKK